MKRTYQTPCATVMHIETIHLMAGTVTDIESNAKLNYGGGGSGPARGRESGGGWDDDED